MVSFLKKLFGGKEQAASAPIEQAAKTIENASAQVDSAVSGAKGVVPDVQAQVQEQATAAEARVSNLSNLASSVMSGGLPDFKELQGAISKLPEGELTSVVSGALDSIPADSRTQLGGLLSRVTGPGGAAAPAGIAGGDSAALGGALSSMLKSEGGLGNLAGLFGGGTAGAAGGGGGGFGDVVSELTGGGGGGFDIAGLMSNPLAKTVLTALIPAITKAVQGK